MSSVPRFILVFQPKRLTLEIREKLHFKSQLLCHFYITKRNDWLNRVFLLIFNHYHSDFLYYLLVHSCPEN